MNMMAIGFSLDWFLTIPGLLISGGVVLLFIALIIFIVTSAKSKRENKEAVEEITPVTPEFDAMVTPIVTGSVNTPVEEVVATETVDYDFMASTPVEPVTEEEVAEVQQSVEMPEIVMPSLVAFEPENTPVEETIVEETPVVEFPTYGYTKVEEESTVVEEPTYLNPIASPIMETPMFETTIQNNVISEEPVVSIYGGVAPVVAPVKEVEPRQIYGGADPLEATQRMAPILPNAVYPEVTPIVNEATLTEPAMVDFTFPEVTPVAYVEERAPYTVEEPIGANFVSQIEEVDPILVQPIPVEVTEKIEEL